MNANQPRPTRTSTEPCRDLLCDNFGTTHAGACSRTLVSMGYASVRTDGTCPSCGARLQLNADNDTVHARVGSYDCPPVPLSEAPAEALLGVLHSVADAAALDAIGICLCRCHPPEVEVVRPELCCPCWIDCALVTCRKFGTIHKAGECDRTPPEPRVMTADEIWRATVDRALRAVDYSSVPGNQPAGDWDCAVVLATQLRLPRPADRKLDDMWQAWVLGPQCLFPGCLARYSAALQALPRTEHGYYAGWHWTLRDMRDEDQELPAHDHTLGPVPSGHTCAAGPLCELQQHDCAYASFLSDPITEYYGVGNEMLHLIDCAGCAELERRGQTCGHESCELILAAPYECAACHSPF